MYSPSDADRAKQAYLEFKPLDGKFLDNSERVTKGFAKGLLARIAFVICR